MALKSVSIVMKKTVVAVLYGWKFYLGIKMKAPCRECENRENAKDLKYLFIKGAEKRVPGKSLKTWQFTPGVNYNNPCWMCDKAKQYDDWIIDNYDFPPVQNPQKEVLEWPKK